MSGILEKNATFDDLGNQGTIWPVGQMLEAGGVEHDEVSKHAGGNNGAPFQKKRRWDRMHQLRREVGVWLSELDAMGEDFRLALWDLLGDDQKQREGMLPAVRL